jgi:uncharacterized protein (TIGR00255 family)
MLLSMTGYGAGSARNSRYAVKVEIKTLNSRFTEFSLRLPDHYFQQEMLLKNKLGAALERGKISLVLSVEYLDIKDKCRGAVVNTEILMAYFRQFEAIRQQLALTEPVALTSLITLPGVVSSAHLTVEPEEWALVEQAVDQALAALQKNRSQEGAAHANDLLQRIALIEQLVEQISPLESRRQEHLQNRLLHAISELRSNIPFDENRLQQEILYYLEKLDIHEEQVRIQSHLKQFVETIAAAESQGRKLQFITQELWREANTLGVKANHAEIQSLVVRIKEELEKIKEQLANLV